MKNCFLPLLLLSCFLGCASKPVTLRTTPSEERIANRYQSSLTGDEISKGTEATLIRMGLWEEYQLIPEQLFLVLSVQSTADDDWLLSFGIAEIARKIANESTGEKKQQALLEAVLASSRAIRKAMEDPGATLHPSFLLAVEMYNDSLGVLFDLLHEEMGPPTRWKNIKGLHGNHAIRIKSEGFDSLDYFNRFRYAESIDFSGFRNRHRSFGLGAPLVAIKEPSDTDPYPEYFPPEGIIYPATLLIEETESEELVITIVNPRKKKQINFYNKPLPISADYTAPYASLLNQTELHSLEDTGFFNPDEALFHQGLFLLEPYDPNKVPLIMVHGLWGSPLTWRELTNEVWGDEILRDRFQVWHFMYPTGGPIIDNAYQLRTSLEKLRDTLGNKETDRALNEMVVVAHSMGGVITRATLTTSGDAIWNTQFSKPFDEMVLEEWKAERIRDTFFFEPIPWIKRAVFIAAPHRGSEMADSFIGQLGVSLVSTPTKVKKIIQRIGEKNPGAIRDEDPEIPTSIDTLSPNNKILQALASQPMKEDLIFHSIIGDNDQGKSGTDGIVLYESSHLAGAESEIVIYGDHYINRHPKAIREVRRILHEHE